MVHLSLLIEIPLLVVAPRTQQVVSEHPRFIVGSYVDSKSINVCLVEIVCRSRNSVGLFVGSCVDLRIVFGLLKESNLVE